jgi:hypothetical protein
VEAVDEVKLVFVRLDDLDAAELLELLGGGGDDLEVA